VSRASRPAAGKVEIFSFSLALPPDELQRLGRVLSAEERARAERLIDPERRDRFVAGRGLLREKLSHFVGEKPEMLRIESGENGKPFLGGDCGENLRFNLSHSGDLALLAVASRVEVGIDLEEVQDDRPLRELALRFFSIRERETLLSLPPHDLSAAFYRCWTRKEAYLKGRGAGFTLRSDSFEVSLLPREPPALLTSAASPSDPERWFLQDLPTPPGFAAALATEGPVRLSFTTQASEGA
jgi:4'-phosphopantetheinyl transferase